MLRIFGFSQRKIQKHLEPLRQIDAWPTRDFQAIEAAMKLSDIVDVKEFEIDGDRFNRYCEQVDYENHYPDYYQEFGADNVWSRKQLEHFISFEVTRPEAGMMYVDVAASASPVSNILREHFGVSKAYSQDLNYKRGVHGDRIGSNASEIPLDDATVDAVLAHNSWEHFEGDSDRGFLVEVGRILKPGGILCIIPFDMSMEAFQITSPAVWHKKYVNAPKLPEFDQRAAVFVDESIRQRLIKFHSPRSFLEDIEGIKDIDFTFWIIPNSLEFKFQRNFLTAQKRV